MRGQNDHKLGEVIKEFIEACRLTDKLNEVNIRENWERITGKMIARHTTKISIRKRILYIEVDSAPLRQELSMARSMLMDALNRNFDSPMIDDIVFK